MDADVGVDELKNLAALIILGDSGLTDELTDKEAKALLDLGMLQADAAVDALLASSDAARVPADGAGALIAGRVAPVRRFVRMVNVLAGKRRRLTPDQMAGELESLRAAAEELPLPPEAPVRDSAISLLAHWSTETDNLGFLLALLHVFGPGQATELDAGDDARQ
jgi:hypothetical protein